MTGSCNRLITLEEGVKTAGWGSEVVAQLTEAAPSKPWRFARIGANPCPIPAAKHLEEQALPSLEDLLSHIHELSL